MFEKWSDVEMVIVLILLMMVILSQGGIDHSIVKNHGKCKTKKSNFLPSNVRMDNHVCGGDGRRQKKIS